MSDLFGNVGGGFDDSFEDQEYYIQSISQHDLGCASNQGPLDRCLFCGPLATLCNSQSSLRTFDGQTEEGGNIVSRRAQITYAQAVGGQQSAPERTIPSQITTQSTLAFPPLVAVDITGSANTITHRSIENFTYAQVAQSAKHRIFEQHQIPQGQSHQSHPQLTTLSSSIPIDEIPGSIASSSQAFPLRPNTNRGSSSRRGSHARRRPSRPYHTALTNDPLQDLVDLPGLTLQPELNSDPRNVSTFVQRTQFGGHRRASQPSIGPSTPSSPAGPGTLSTGSNRSRRRGDAMRDPSLPFRYEGCGNTFHNQEDHRRHVTRTHGDNKPHLCPNCGKGFIHPKDLRRHEDTHRDKETRIRIECPYIECGKSFTRQDNLNRHLREHGTVDSAIASSRGTSRHGSFSSQQQWQGP